MPRAGNFYLPVLEEEDRGDEFGVLLEFDPPLLDLLLEVDRS
jgi:hypothetical protein